MDFINDLTCVITNALVDGESVNIKTFGEWKVKERGGRMGTDPNTHEPVMRDGYLQVLFSAHDTLRNAVKSGTHLDYMANK